MIKVNVIVSDDVISLFSLSQEKLKNYAVNVLETTDVSESDINIVLVNDKYMAELNEKYKKRIGPTDVLSFILSEENTGKVEGEVYVSLERAGVQARKYDIPFEEEVIRLVTHGLLHLTGRKHDTDEDYLSMVQDTEKFTRNFFSNGE